MKMALTLELLLVAAFAGAWEPPPEKLLPGTAQQELSAARWIWFRCVKIPEKSTAAMRRVLTVDEPVTEAFFHAACDDNGRLFFNGTRICSEPVDIHNSDRFVRTYRIPAELWKTGENVLAAEVFNDEGQGGMMLRGEVRFASGRVLHFFSDGDWRAMELPVAGDWKSPGFDDSRWGHAMELGDVMTSPWRSVCRRLREFMMTGEEKTAYRKYMNEKAGNIDFLRDAPDAKGRIVWRNGRAGIEVDGKVEVPMLYIAGGSPWDPHNADAIMKANLTGIKFIEIQNTASRFMVEPGRYDFSELDEDMRRAVALAPDAYFCMMLSFHFGYTEWHKTYPDAQIGYATGPADGKGGQIGRFKSPSMADPRNYRELEAYATQFMEFAKKRPWYKRVVMIRATHGVTSEWHYYGMKDDMPDTSREMTATFRKYLRKKYASDEALRQAWHDPEVTLDTALVPGAKERFGKRRFLRDPASPDRQVLDYYDCMQDVVADLLIRFLGCFKQADPRLIVGTYYGYVYHMAFPPEGQVIRFDKVLASPNVDFLSSPFNYDADSRFVGGDAQPRAVSDPFKRHGKLMFYEADTRTHIAGMDAVCTSRCRNAADSVAVLRNNIGRAFLDGGGVQFLEFDARRGRQGWFNHPEIYRTFRQSLELWRILWNDAPEPAARVAVVLSPEELARHGYPVRKPQLSSIPNLIDKPVHALLRSGVTCDFMTLRGFLESPHEYKIVVLLNVFGPTPEERSGLLKKLRRPGVVAVWNYAPGLVTDAGYDETAMSGLCGIRLRARSKRLPMAATLSDGAKLFPVWNKTPWRESPRCYAADQRAETWAVYDASPEPAVALKRLDDGSTAVFCGMPGITAHFWRLLWRKLGVPTVTEPDTVVAAGNTRHLLVHTGKGGAFELRLPPGKDSAVELYTRERFPVVDGVLTLTSPAAATWFLEIGGRH